MCLSFEWESHMSKFNLETVEKKFSNHRSMEDVSLTI